MFVIREKATGKYRTATGKNNDWSSDLTRAHIFKRPNIRHVWWYLEDEHELVKVGLVIEEYE